MSEGLYAEPGIIKKAHYDQDDKEGMVDIYVSVESLRVYDNPWVEGASPNAPAPTSAQHAASLVSERSGKRSHVRGDSVFLGVVCLLLLIGIICLAVQMDEDKTKWRRERKQLLADNVALNKTIGQLTAKNHELKDAFGRRLCAKKPKKSECLTSSESS